MSKELPPRTRAKRATQMRDNNVSITGSGHSQRCDLSDAAMRESQDPFLLRLHAFEEMKTAWTSWRARSSGCAVRT